MVDIRSHAFSIILAAAIFAVLGYYMFSWQYATATPPMILLLKWTLRAGAIVFAVAGLLILLRLSPGLLIGGAAGSLSAVVFLAVGGWEITSNYHSGPGLLGNIILAAWTGYTGVSALRDFFAIVRAAPAPPAPPTTGE